MSQPRPINYQAIGPRPLDLVDSTTASPARSPAVHTPTSGGDGPAHTPHTIGPRISRPSPDANGPARSIAGFVTADARRSEPRAAAESTLSRIDRAPPGTSAAAPDPVALAYRVGSDYLEEGREQMRRWMPQIGDGNDTLWSWLQEASTPRPESARVPAPLGAPPLAGPRDGRRATPPQLDARERGETDRVGRVGGGSILPPRGVLPSVPSIGDLVPSSRLGIHTAAVRDDPFESLRRASASDAIARAWGRLVDKTIK